MLDVSKILLTLDLEEPSLSAVHQAAVLARHFHSEIILLHVVRPLTYLSIHEGRHGELLRERVKEAEEKLETRVRPELDGIPIKRLVSKGDPAHVVAQAARDEGAKLIVMSTHGSSKVAGFLMGSVTAKVLSAAECPIWTAPHQGTMPEELNVRSVLCALDFNPRDRARIEWAKAVSAEFGARLTLAHVTPSVEIYGPGGYHVIPELKKELFAVATKNIAKLQQETGTTAEIFVGSGDVPKVLNEAVKQTQADLLVIGRRPRMGWLGGHAYSIISHARVPVLSV